MALKFTNYITGEVYRSGKAHIPDVLEAVIMMGISENTEAAVKDGKGITTAKLKQPIEFAYKVSIERKADNEDGSISYQYQTQPLTEIKTNDQLSHLSALLLDAPAEAPAKAAKAPKKKAAKW